MEEQQQQKSNVDSKPDIGGIINPTDESATAMDAAISEETGDVIPNQGNSAWCVSYTHSNNHSNTTTSKDNISTKPVSFASIMAEQTSQSEQRKSDRVRPTRVTFCEEVENEEERMLRLAIEASLREPQHDSFQLGSHCEKKSALKSDDDSMKSPASFASNDTTITPSDDMDEDMKMVIALSLQETGQYGAKIDDFIDGGKQPTTILDDQNMPAVTDGVDKNTTKNTETSSITTESTHISAVASFALTSACSESNEDESEKLARALHDAELAEFNSHQSANAAAEEASLKLAMMLQEEEDNRLRSNLSHNEYSEAARLKREHMCRGGGRGGATADIGVRTVKREEFNKLKSDGTLHFDERVIELRKFEEKGMGKLLKSSGQFSDNDVSSYVADYNCTTNTMENDDYYYAEEYEEEGIRMNPQTKNGATSVSWKRLDKNTFVGSNNEVRTKHDPELVKSANASKLKDAYSIGSSKVSNSAYNSFKRAEARQTGMKKGVARQAHGRAENMNSAKTRGGAMDGSVRLQIAAAINQGLIERCNGVVKEGKEALVYHAEGRLDTQQSDFYESSSLGYDVAVKVFKRISEFKGRGMYVDGDPRFHKQKFKSNDQREQVVLWAEKEYRNLIRAHRGGVRVPLALRQKENVLFMRFLGENGWPSPQLREVEMKKGSDRWIVLYCQTITAIRRLYHCSRLVHGDLSEYNLLLCPSWQLSKDPILQEQKRTDEDKSLVVVLIDFGQAVEREHPSAGDLLRRDIQTVKEFFSKQGIATLPVQESIEFVLAPFSTNANDVTVPVDDEDNSTWRHNIPGWDDQKVMDKLLAKLEANEASIGP